MERYWPKGSGTGLATHLITSILKDFAEVKVVTGTRNHVVGEGIEYIYEPLLDTKEVVPLLLLNSLAFASTGKFVKLVKWSDIVYIPGFAYPLIPAAKKLGKIVIVHCHDYMPVTYSAAILAPYEKHKHMIKEGDELIERIWGLKYFIGYKIFWWRTHLIKRCLVEADQILCVSKRQAKIIGDLLPEVRNKIQVIYNPLPNSFLNVKKNLNSSAPTFLYVSGERYIKGFWIMLKLIMELVRYRTKVNFIFTNEFTGKPRRALQNVITRYGDLIRHVGRVTDKQLLQLHSGAWGLIFPSIWEEPLPYAVMESMASGTIPIASKVGGIPEIVEGTIAESFLFSLNSMMNLLKRLST
jgi:glycosyltransferase involved in cell wall biosynthesis